MQKNRGRFRRNLVLSLLIIMLLPGETVRNVGEYLLRTPLTVQRLEFLLHVKPAETGMFLLWTICLVTAAVSLLKMLTGTGRKNAAPDPVKRMKSQPPRRSVKNSEKAVPGKTREETEEALRCEHKRGKEKYLEQIDGYLKTGLIDRTEYKILRERYSKLNIPDDYH